MIENGPAIAFYYPW